LTWESWDRDPQAYPADYVLKSRRDIC